MRENGQCAIGSAAGVVAVGPCTAQLEGNLRKTTFVNCVAELDRAHCARLEQKRNSEACQRQVLLNKAVGSDEAETHKTIETYSSPGSRGIRNPAIRGHVKQTTRQIQERQRHSLDQETSYDDSY